MNNSNTFASMFPLPPHIPEGKNRNKISYLNPVTDQHDKVIDRGIMDGAYFIHHPNETKKFASVQTDSYNFINIVDGIFVDGAKCYPLWTVELYKQISIIHKEFLSVVGDRVQYKELKITPPEPIPLERQQAVFLEYELEFESDTLIEDRFIESQEASLVESNIIVNYIPPMIDASLAYPYDQECTPVEGITTAKLPPETRKWIHHLRYIHPAVDGTMRRSLELYEPVSEHMGENVITYNSDTCSVDISDWGKPTRTKSNIINPECVFAYETPHHLREIIRERMHPEQPDEINKGWTELNRMMARTLPSEVTLTTEPGTGLWIHGERDPKEPHGAILVNDYYHWKDRIDPIKIPVAHDLFAYLEDACQLVNHMYPLLNNVRAEHAEIKHEHILVKDVEQNWIIYKDQAPEGGARPAPIDVDVELDRWGYAETDIITFDWEIGVGLSVEETYPRKKIGSGEFYTDLLGTRLPHKIVATDNRALMPEIVKVPIA